MTWALTLEIGAPSPFAHPRWEIKTESPVLKMGPVSLLSFSSIHLFHCCCFCCYFGGHTKAYYLALHSEITPGSTHRPYGMPGFKAQISCKQDNRPTHSTISPSHLLCVSWLSSFNSCSSPWITQTHTPGATNTYVIRWVGGIVTRTTHWLWLKILTSIFKTP